MVNYEGESYPGEIKAMQSNLVTVNAMQATSNKNAWKWPSKPDVHTYPVEDIKKINAPIPCGSRAAQFIFKD